MRETGFPGVAECNQNNKFCFHAMYFSQNTDLHYLFLNNPNFYPTEPSGWLWSALHLISRKKGEKAQLMESAQYWGLHNRFLEPSVSAIFTYLGPHKDIKGNRSNKIKNASSSQDPSVKKKTHKSSNKYCGSYPTDLFTIFGTQNPWIEKLYILLRNVHWLKGSVGHCSWHNNFAFFLVFLGVVFCSLSYLHPSWRCKNRSKVLWTLQVKTNSLLVLVQGCPISQCTNGLRPETLAFEITIAERSPLVRKHTWMMALFLGCHPHRPFHNYSALKYVVQH